jgi:hypothetical protein
MKRGAVAVCSAVLLLAAAHVSARSASSGRDACQLLTASDVKAVQGAPFSSAKLSTHGDRSQCFYQLPAFVDSISLDVIRGGGRAFWRENFEQDGAARGEREREENEEHEAKRAPKRVRGVGDEAFWVGSRGAGSLYVLRGTDVLRVSVGGAASEAEKISRSKRLAAKALPRL